jgi:hypothetical protein
MQTRTGTMNKGDKDQQNRTDDDDDDDGRSTVYDRNARENTSHTNDGRLQTLMGRERNERTTAGERGMKEKRIAGVTQAAKGTAYNDTNLTKHTTSMARETPKTIVREQEQANKYEYQCSHSHNNFRKHHR